MTKVVAWLIKVQEPWYMQIMALIATALLYSLLLGTINGCVALAAILLHEFGHLIVYKMAGKDAKILVMFPLGAVAIIVNKGEKRSNVLPYWTLGWLMLAGVVMNGLQIVIGLVLAQQPGLVGEIGDKVILINSVLLAFNMLPISNFDGGTFFKVISSTMRREYAKILTVVMMIVVLVTIVAFLAVTISGNVSLFVVLGAFGKVGFLLLCIPNVWVVMNHHDINFPVTPGSMNLWQTAIMLLVYSGLVVLLLSV